MEDKTEMYRKYYKLLETWMQNLENGKKIENYFLYNNYKQIALYGMGKMANHVLKELKESKVRIVYAIDRNPEIDVAIPVISTNEKEFPSAEAIIVTPIYDFPNIEKKLSRVLDIPIISLSEVINETSIL